MGGGAGGGSGSNFILAVHFGVMLVPWLDYFSMTLLAPSFDRFVMDLGAILAPQTRPKSIENQVKHDIKFYLIF